MNKSQISPVNEERILEGMPAVRTVLNALNLNEHERIVLLQDLLAHENNVLERKNAASVMFSALNKVGR